MRNALRPKRLHTICAISVQSAYTKPANPCKHWVSGQRGLFKLYRSRWFTRQIIKYSINPLYLINNPVHNLIQNFIWNFCRLCSHKVNCFYSSECYCIIICSKITHYSNASHVRKCRKILIDITVKTSLCNLFSVNCIRILNNFYLLICHFTDNTDSKSWSRERLTKYQALWNSKFKTSLSYFVFEQVAKRLDDFFKINIVWQTAYVVMRFDYC